MKIVVAGGTGFIGREVVKALLPRGEVLVLSRHPERVKQGRGVLWNPSVEGPWQKEVRDASVIINLAGENIGEGRWTDERKRQLTDSRIGATRALVSALGESTIEGRLFISASAIGYYGPRGDESLDETAPAGNDFLARLTADWEAEARKAEATARVVLLRFGIVLAQDGGALGKMILPFKMFAGGPMGSGKQWMSWVHRDDVVRMIEWTIDRPECRGVYNVTAPQPVTNKDFASELGRALSRPALIPTPGFALRIALGEMADALLLSGQKVLPSRAVAEGFKLRYERLSDALANILKG
ncbi:MAG TPA: TIGR01777 family oxidoreductase [Thermoanaerobaculia bacterium]|nr:TIGR01777 family oxidoreductase [Thermoanaerobaculia bacterium]